jgi:hypothetical protein
MRPTIHWEVIFKCLLPYLLVLFHHFLLPQNEVRNTFNCFSGKKISRNKKANKISQSMSLRQPGMLSTVLAFLKGLSQKIIIALKIIMSDTLKM